MFFVINGCAFLEDDAGDFLPHQFHVIPISFLMPPHMFAEHLFGTPAGFDFHAVFESLAAFLPRGGHDVLRLQREHGDGGRAAAFGHASRINSHISAAHYNDFPIFNII